MTEQTRDRWRAEHARLARLRVGRTIHLELTNPSGAMYRAACFVAGFGAFLALASRLLMHDHGGPVLLAGIALIAVGGYFAWVAARVARHPKFELTLGRSKLVMPQAPYHSGETMELNLRDVEDVVAMGSSRQRYWATRLSDGTTLRLPVDLVRPEHQELELLTRIRTRVMLAKKSKKVDPAALAAVEALVLTDGPSLGAVVVSDDKGAPEVFAVVRDTNEWAKIMASGTLPPNHKLVVPDDVAEPLRNSLTLSERET